MNIILRRRKLGAGSTKAIQGLSTTCITVVRNDAEWPAHTDYVFRWGCTSSLTARDSVTAVVVNTAKSIHWCSDKRQGRLDMQGAGVSVPATWIDFSAVDSYPVVVRPAQHSQGKRLYVANTDVELQVILQEQFLDNQNGFYISELINKVAEYRVAVVCGRVAWVARKTPGNPDDVAWNVAQGGRFDNVKWSEWPMAVVVQALGASNVSGTDFCGVDVMVDSSGVAYVLEVNSAPSLTSPYRQACFAKCFDYIVMNGKGVIPVSEHDVGNYPYLTSWKQVVHPAIWNG